MSVIASLLVLAVASSSVEHFDDDRLRLGSLWRCKHLLNEDKSPTGDLYEMDFLIGETKEKSVLPRLSKQIIITKTSGEIPMEFTAYGSEKATKNLISKSGFLKEYDFLHDFNNWGKFVTVGWWKKKPYIHLTIRSFNYEFREDPSKRDEMVFAFQCVQGRES
jgi:hypothetical protein